MLVLHHVLKKVKGNHRDHAIAALSCNHPKGRVIHVPLYLDDPETHDGTEIPRQPLIHKTKIKLIIKYGSNSFRTNGEDQ